MPYKEVNCIDCDGSGKARCYACTGGWIPSYDGTLIVCSSCRGTGKFTCLTCRGTGVKEKWIETGKEYLSENNELYKQKLDFINLAMTQVLADALNKKEITDSKFLKLMTWWHEFIETLKMPIEQRPAKLLEVVKKGESSFKEIDTFNNILFSLRAINFLD